MPQVFFRKFKTKGVYANQAAFRRVITSEFQNHIGPDLIKLHDLTTADWKKRPDFKSELAISQRGIGVSVFPDPADSASMIWLSHNKGLPGRTLRPNPARRRKRIASRKRRLDASYKRDTRKIGRLRRPTALRFIGRGGEVVFRNEIPWPGIAARRYTTKIAKQYRPVYLRRMQNAVRRAVRAAQREGS